MSPTLTGRQRRLGRGYLSRERAPERRDEKGRSRKVPHSLEVGGCKVADLRRIAQSRFCNRRPQLTRSLFSFTAFFEWTVARRRFTGSWCLVHIESVRIFSLPHCRRLHIRACPFLFQQDRTTGSRIWNRPGLPIGREHRDGIGRIHPQLLDQ